MYALFIKIDIRLLLDLPQNDQELVEKALSVRKLAKEVHDTIMKRSIPRGRANKSVIREYLGELDK